MTQDPCARWQLLVQAAHDGELGVAEAADLEVHLRGCPACRALAQELSEMSAALRAVPRHVAPDPLRRQLERQAAAAGSNVVPFRPRRTLLAAGASVAVAAAVMLALLPATPQPGDAAIASHIRAMQPGHLTDVVSSDQHTVKPWFNGRLDYAPPVRDFKAEGFPLLGGRLDYLEHRSVAALAYGRDKHVIDLYVWPDSEAATGTRSAEGYNVVSWAGGGMQFLAVSDLNMPELRAFAALWRDSSP